MVVYLGPVNLDNIRSWDGEGSSTIPIKKVIRKSTPTMQAQYYCRTPRQIVLTARVTSAYKEALHTMRNLHTWQQLLDYDGVTKVDDVWIEKVSESWKGDEDESYPWLVTIQLLCSTL